MKVLLTAFVLVFAFINPVMASSSLCSLKGTKIVYTNGILTKKTQADQALIKIKLLKLDTQIDSKKVHYEVAYNYSYDRARDMLEVIIQSIPTSALAEHYSHHNRYQAYFDFLDGSLLARLSPTQVQTVIHNVEEVKQAINRNFVNAKEVATKYKDTLDEKKRVLAISHSQGSLFINQAYEILEHPDKEKYFAAFQIASISESNRLPPKSHYVTHNWDRIVNNFRLIMSEANPPVDVLPPNVFILWTDNHPDYNEFSDWFEWFMNHGMMSTYLHDWRLKDAVSDGIILSAEMLDSNCLEAHFKEPTIDPLIPRRVSFDASDSMGNDLIYEWNFGGTGTQDGDGAFPVFTYSSGGTYTVSLIVQDSQGQRSDPFTRTIDIQEGAAKCGGAKGDNHNGGDAFVAETATVDPSVFLMGNVEVCDTTEITGGAFIMSNGGNIKFTDSPVVDSSTMIFVLEGSVEISGEAKISGMIEAGERSALVEIKDNVEFKGLLQNNSGQALFSGTSTFGPSTSINISGEKSILTVNAGHINSDFSIGSSGEGQSSVIVSNSGKSILGRVNSFVQSTGNSTISISNSTINGLVGAGIESGSTGSSIVTISNSTINGFVGAGVGSGSTGSSTLSITGSTVSGSVGAGGISFSSGNSSVSVNSSTIGDIGSLVARTSGAGNANAGISSNAILNGRISVNATSASGLISKSGINICSGAFFSFDNGEYTTNYPEACEGTTSLAMLSSTSSQEEPLKEKKFKENKRSPSSIQFE